MEAAVDLYGPEDPRCQSRVILNHRDNPSSPTRLFLLLTLSSSVR